MALRVFLITLLAALSFGFSQASAEPRDFRALPRTTERPVRECGDDCSGVPQRVAPQSHARMSVGRGLPPQVHSLPHEGRPHPLVLAEGEIKEEDLQEDRSLAPGWMGSPRVPIVPSVPEEILPAEPEERSAVPSGELRTDGVNLPSVDGEKKPVTALGREAPFLQPDDPSPLIAKITPETSPQRAVSLRLTEEGRKLLGTGEYLKALNKLEKTISIDSTNPYSYYYLARVHHQLTHYRESLNFLDVAESLLSEESIWLAQVFALKGRNFQILGSFERADASYVQALKLDPNNQGAFEAITQIRFEKAGPLK